MVKARFGIALSPRPSSFAPLLFAGRLTEGLRAAAEAGFEAVEISLRSPDDLSRDELRTMLNQYGLSLTAIATGQACLHDSLCLSDPRPKVRQAALDRLNSMIRLAAPFGAFTIIGGIRGRLTGREAEQKEQQRSAVEAIRECARLASGLGVTLLVEPINRYETNFINTADEGLRLLDEIAEPAVKLLLDTFHMNIEEPNLPLALRKAGTRLGALHLADSNRQAPGRGHIDFAPIFRALAEIRFAGPIAAEILPMPDDAAAVRLTADFLRVAVASRKQGVVTT
ncbi:MAG: sugar phosphate isomerase/epimerase [Chloroflexi bacterium]|nr:sugar phosphate isomerase/epimerase [Chloroflexota bacterium]